MCRSDVRVAANGNGYHKMGAPQDNAPLGSAESTRAACNGMTLGDRNVAKRCCTEVGGRDKCRAMLRWSSPVSQVATPVPQSGRLTNTSSLLHELATARG